MKLNLRNLLYVIDLLEPMYAFGLILINKTFDDKSDDNDLVIESIRLFKDHILVETLYSQLEIFKETFICIEGNVNSNNEVYAITCYKKDRQNFIQLIVGFSKDK